MNKEEKILDCIKKGIPLSKISKELSIPNRTLRWRMAHREDYKIAKEAYNSWLISFFGGVDN